MAHRQSARPTSQGSLTRFTSRDNPLNDAFRLPLGERRAISNRDINDPRGAAPSKGDDGISGLSKRPSRSSERSTMANRLQFQIDNAARDAQLGIFSDFRLERLQQNRAREIRETQRYQRVTGRDHVANANALFNNNFTNDLSVQTGNADIALSLVDNDPGDVLSGNSEAQIRLRIQQNRRTRARNERTKTFKAFVKEQSRDRLLRQGGGTNTVLSPSRAPSTVTTGTTLLRS